MGTKKRPIVYSGRGRPPKKAMMPTDLSEGAASPLPKGSPAAVATVASAAAGEGAAASPGGGATGQEVGVAGDSSDEGGEEEDVEERVYDGEYSEEDTDEEVSLLHHDIYHRARNLAKWQLSLYLLAYIHVPVTILYQTAKFTCNLAIFGPNHQIRMCGKFH